LTAGFNHERLFGAAQCGSVPIERCRTMDKNRIVGSAKQLKGSVKEAVGKVVGDAKLQIDGKADQAEGRSKTWLVQSRIP